MYMYLEGDKVEGFSCIKCIAHTTLVTCMLQEAIAAESYLVPPKTVNFGDAVGAMSRAKHVLEGEVRMGGQEHFYLETQATLAVPTDGDGEMEIYSSTQDPAHLQVDSKLHADILEEAV